jgi:pyruvate/2-oxoglutarate dehydrogenase complex dihydrolipoamide dehydrogenase (E3) component
MTQYDYDLGIIGGGAAGLTVASGAAQLGAKTLLIEKEPQLGGDCLHYGCVPSKTLIRTAQVYQLMKNSSKFGLPPITPSPVDFGKVTTRIQSVIDEIQKHDSVDRFCQLGVKVEFGSSVFEDEHQVMINGRRVAAAKWVIASGSSPAAPPYAGLDKVPFLTNKELFSLESLPASMVILGAGPIAIEMAQAFSRLGTRVEVIQRSSQILSKEDKDMADIIMHNLRQEGVIFHLNSTVEVIEDAGGARSRVTIKKKGDEQLTKLEAEKLLVAMGRRANLEGLGLEKIDIDFSPKGLTVDKRLRTSQKHIYAAGDVTGSYQFTHAAGYEGGIVLSNAVFHLPRKVDYATMPWCTYTEPELASIGMNSKVAQAAGIEYSEWIEEFKENDRSLAEGNQVGLIKMLLDGSEKPIGVQIAGPHAGELLNEWVAVMNGGVKLMTLAGAVHPYPTLGEISKRVAGKPLARKLFSAKVKKGLKFFFGLKGRACDI